MLLHPTNPNLKLLTFDDIRSDRWQSCFPWQSAPAYLAVAWWVETFVCARHAELGRDGLVCPFVRPSIDRQLCWLSGQESEVHHSDDLVGVMLDYREWFLELPPQDGNDKVYKAIIVLFPHLQNQEGCDIIDAAHLTLKREFVQKGLMLGQFHPLCQEPGVRQEDFRPLRAPVPLLVIRHMTRFDLPFLTGREYLAEYQARFGNQVPDRYRELYSKALVQAGLNETSIG